MNVGKRIKWNDTCLKEGQRFLKGNKDKWDTGESYDKIRSTGGRNGKPLQYSCHENPINSTKSKKDMTLKDEPPQVGRCPNAAGEEWKAITNSSRKNEAAGPKRT